MRVKREIDPDGCKEISCEEQRFARFKRCSGPPEVPQKVEVVSGAAPRHVRREVEHERKTPDDGDRGKDDRGAKVPDAVHSADPVNRGMV
jgi:hypothetical protein